MNQLQAQVPTYARLLRGDALARFELRRAERQEQARRDEIRYRDLLAAESERALRGESPTVWDGGKFAPRMRAPIALADYPLRGASGSLILRAEALPQSDGRRVFVSRGVRVAHLVCADGSSWLEIQEVGKR